MSYFSHHGVLEDAKKNYFESLVAYSIVTYLLQIKDRHNGNILMDSDGRIIHIDFGFLLSTSPGNNMNFESYFKLTPEYIEILELNESTNLQAFRKLFIRGLMELRKHQEKIILPIEIMAAGDLQQLLPCFRGHASAEITLAALKANFFPGVGEEECIANIEGILDASINSWRSSQYDAIQRLQNGIV